MSFVMNVAFYAIFYVCDRLASIANRCAHMRSLQGQKKPKLALIGRAVKNNKNRTRLH